MQSPRCMCQCAYGYPAGNRRLKLSNLLSFTRRRTRAAHWCSRQAEYHVCVLLIFNRKSPEVELFPIVYRYPADRSMPVLVAA